LTSSSGRGGSAAYLVDVRGGKPQRLRVNVFGVWSPDGRLLLGLLASGGVAHPIGYVELDSGHVTQVSPVHDDGSDFSPVWSPDGTRIAYVTLKSDGSSASLVVVNRDGTGASPIDEEPDLQSPQWSPDGQMIAFIDRGAVVIGADGNGRRALGPGRPLSDAPDTEDGAMSWSPDSTRLAYSNSHQVVVANADGTGMKILTLTRVNPEQYYDRHVKWQPGGKEILFIRAWGDNGGPQGVGLVDATTGSIRFVATQQSITSACWSPDGAWIAYTGTRIPHPGTTAHATSGVWVVRSDGSGEHQIATLPNPSWCAWRPMTK
jgi:Tol biopolymer transport system component